MENVTKQLLLCAEKSKRDEFEQIHRDFFADQILLGVYFDLMYQICSLKQQKSFFGCRSLFGAAFVVISQLLLQDLPILV